MAPLSNTLAWKIPWMEEPGRLQSMGSLRVRHDWATSLSLFTFIHWRRKWQPSPAFIVYRLLDSSHSDWREMVPQCGFDLHFSHNEWMAPHSSTLAWKIPCTEEPGRLQSMGSLRVEHDWATSLSLFTFMHWRRKWQPTPVFLPGESQGRGSLVGCSPLGH